MISASGLGKRYKKTTVLHDLTFTVETGKVTGFLGPNGAGKSTTMRLMLGLDSGSGITTFDSKKLVDYDQPSHVVGTLLEAKAFHPTRSAQNHLRVLADAGGIDQTRVQEVLDMVGLGDVGSKKPGKFSLGMSQRLGIAAAILGNPKYLMLDEPANGLDPEGIAWLRQFIKDYAAAGNAVFVSSHQLSEMSQMADNVVVIGKGKLIAETSISQLISQSGRSGVLVRTPDTAKFEQLLRQSGLEFNVSPGGFAVNAQTTDQVGKLAFEAGIMLTELSSHKASLEEAFLALTEDSQEYRTGATPIASTPPPPAPQGGLVQ